jgi:flavin-dependent thymidylate synthase
MSSEVEKWADKAMFPAETMPVASPKVHLLWMTPDPLGAAAALNSIYVGKVKRSLSEVTRSEREALLSDMQRTVLATPLEAIKLHFLIEGVTRAFTHQLVRNRTSAYAQESMRFAVLGADGAEIPVAVPPSIATRQPGVGAETFHYAQEEWKRTVESIEAGYRHLINLGVPAEDARGLLPTNVLTRIHWVTDLRSLTAEAGKRLSTQAQFEWKSVIASLARAIREYNPYANVIASAGNWGSDDESTIAKDVLAWVAEGDRWQYEAISDLFRPICYRTGKCEFMAEADRFCTIRDRVNANHEIGRPSSEWHKPFIDVPSVADGGRPSIPAIHPEEWLADPTAAR